MKTRVSTIYKMGRKQPSLDFVDVDIRGDTRVFVDPMALRLLPSPWANHCVSLVQSFFRAVLNAINKDDDNAGQILLGSLHEPNETHLGLSKGKAKGRALGAHLATNVWNALKESEAAKSGLLEDLEDTVLMIEGIRNDMISDITTNIIREPLIEYTQRMCLQHGIPTENDVVSGPLWNPRTLSWDNKFVRLPVTPHGKLLFVPKAIVRRRMEYNDQEYYRNYILPYLMEQELNANTNLVRVLKSGRRKVCKKDLIAKYGIGKTATLHETLRNPRALQDYRRDKRQNPRKPLSHFDLADSDIGGAIPDWDELLRATISLSSGAENAGKYEDAVEQLITALFYPSLADPIVQHEIHDGRKRIDITYTNMALRGFFQWLGTHYPSQHIFVECKNYSADVGNPELDQLSGRFSPSRGKFGILICRSLQNKKLFEARCRDTAKDDRGFVIVLDDHDLSILTKARKDDDFKMEFELLKQKFNALIM